MIGRTPLTASPFCPLFERIRPICSCLPMGMNLFMCYGRVLFYDTEKKRYYVNSFNGDKIQPNKILLKNGVKFEVGVKDSLTIIISIYNSKILKGFEEDIPYELFAPRISWDDRKIINKHLIIGGILWQTNGKGELCYIKKR